MKKIIILLVLACSSQFFGCVRPADLTPISVTNSVNANQRTIRVENCNGSSNLTLECPSYNENSQTQSISIYYQTPETYTYQAAIREEESNAIVFNDNITTNENTSTPAVFTVEKVYKATFSGVCPGTSTTWTIVQRFKIGGGGIIVILDSID